MPFHKSCPVEVKAAGKSDGLEAGQFRAVVSVFGNRDSYGDVVVPGAFSKTLEEWKASGANIPVFWSHQMNDPDMCLGWVVEAEETDVGLEVLAQLDLAEGGPAKAQTVYRLLKREGSAMQFSFAYDVRDGGVVEKDGQDPYYELRDLKLYEVGPTPIGANQETELLAVKSVADHASVVTTELKAGRVLSSSNESTLREALAALEDSASQIKNVLAAVDGSGKASPVVARASGAAKDEEPRGAKSEEPTHGPSADTWLTAIQLSTLEGESL